MSRFLVVAFQDCLFGGLLTLIVLPAINQAQIVERERPVEWKQLIAGEQFIDLFEPMPIIAPLTRETWGGDNVLPRDITLPTNDPSSQ